MKKLLLVTAMLFTGLASAKKPVNNIGSGNTIGFNGSCPRGYSELIGGPYHRNAEGKGEGTVFACQKNGTVYNGPWPE